MLDPASEKLSQFILTVIDSIGQLEVLLLLRAHPERDWSASEVSDELRTNAPSATEHLDRLTHHGLFALSESPPRRYRFRPRTPELAAAVDLLNQAYRDDRVAVINMIYSKPMERIRIFADAFKIRKEDS
jgi:predicted ArsR family transcriptional regulator